MQKRVGLAREPMLDHRELVHSAETFDAETAEDFWEVGASGRAYSRNHVHDAHDRDQIRGM